VISAATELRCAISEPGRGRGLMLIIVIGSWAGGIDVIIEFANFDCKGADANPDEKAGR
jgi:hypothetical protein